MKRFGLTEEQADAILELKLYRLAKLEILVVQKELGEKRAEVKRLEGLLKSEKQALEAGARRARRDQASATRPSAAPRSTASDEPEYQAEDFIATKTPTWSSPRRAGSSVCARSRTSAPRACARATRARGGGRLHARVGGVLLEPRRLLRRAASTTCRPSTGYGDPVQKLFKLADGERMIAHAVLRSAGARGAAPSVGAPSPSRRSPSP
jgi:DNA gyrase subunit A